MANEKKLDPKLVKEAKKAAAGPLGQEMARFSLRFSSALYFGKPPIKGSKPNIKNGTATVINFGNEPIIITAQHVIQSYKDWLMKDKDLIFQIGNLKIDPLPRIISESKKHDLVTLRLTEKEREEIAQGEEIGKFAYSPPSWPPDLPVEKDFITFGGFPGTWRQYPASNEIIFDTFSCGAEEIASVSQDKFIVKFSRKDWVESFNNHQHKKLCDLGGLSGSPCFLIKKLPSNILTFSLIGIVFEFSKMADAMYVTMVHYINKNGVIDE